MNRVELKELGIDREAWDEVYAVVQAKRADGMPMSGIKVLLKDIVRNVDTVSRDQYEAVSVALADKILALRNDPHVFVERDEPAPYRIWGDHSTIEAEAIQQLVDACRLPAAVRAALMPDAHFGYGLPIGGVLAMRNAVVPYAVGVDIACRMCLTVTDLSTLMLEQDHDRLVKAIERNTRFGMGASFARSGRRRHRVMDEDWGISPVTNQNYHRAWEQLGSSGGGNHFVEFGIYEGDDGIKYLALMSHSGSRGTGMAVANHYSKLAAQRCHGLPKELKNLAWLSLDSEEGHEYWAAMELMGRYASANHELIHDTILRTLGAETIFRVENHHNFAWKETHDGEEVVVHRKGATPAQEGVKGVIPGSMGTPAYLVEGKGSDASLCSAAHGAGRRMSRTEAKRRFSRDQMEQFLFRAGVNVISGGLDECPMAYKDIHRVMADQADLVDVKGTFRPKLVKMAPEQKGRRR